MNEHMSDHTNEHTCKTIRPLLALRPEAWSDDQRRQVQAHLPNCARCAAMARDYAEQDRLFDTGMPRVGLAVEQRASLLSQVERERRAYDMSKKWQVVLKSVAGAVAIVVLVFVLNWIFSGMSGQKQAQPGAPAPTATMTATIAPSPTPVSAVVETPVAAVSLSGPIFAEQLALESDLPATACIRSDQALSTMVFSVTLTWRALEPVEADWSYFIHLVDENDQLVLQQDGQGDWPDQVCGEGQSSEGCVLVTEHQVFIPGDIKPGEYTLFVGLYDPVTMARASVRGGDGAESRVAIERLVILGSDEVTPSIGFAYGIQADILLDPNRTASMVSDLGLGWFRQEVRWAEIEPQKGRYDWARLDAIVNACETAGIRLLLTVIGSPAWARDGEPGVGPPDDVQDFADLMAAMAARYRGRVHAYEIWHSQNLASHWEGAPLSPHDYVQLLRAAHQAVKAADPDALVVSGGLSQTPGNDANWALDNLKYLEQMVAEGLVCNCDAVGIHADGYANPPDAYYQDGDFDPAREAFDDHRVFFFRNTIEDSFAVMKENGDGDKPIWVTHFGWGTVDGLGMETPQGQGFFGDIDETKQAEYIVNAFKWAKAWGHLGGMFLDNLQVSPTRSDFGLAYSIVRPDGTPRPAYTALQEMMVALDTTP